MPDRILSRRGGLIVFCIVVAAFLIVSIRTEIQQEQINSNTKAIIDANYRGCLGGVAILDRYNKQMEELARIEEKYQTADLKLRDERVKAYLGGRVVPLPQCQAPK